MCSTPPATASTADPDGGAPLSDATKRRKKRNADKILTRDSDLRGNLAYRGDRDSVEVGSPGVYVAGHQFGAARGTFGKISRGRPIPSRGATYPHVRSSDFPTRVAPRNWRKTPRRGRESAVICADASEALPLIA